MTTRHWRRWLETSAIDPDRTDTRFFIPQDAMFKLMQEPKFYKYWSTPEGKRLFKVAQSLTERTPVDLSSSAPLEETEDSFIVLPPPPILVIETWKEIIDAIARDSGRLFSLSWAKFEDLIAYLMDSFGWDIEPLARTKDGGVDIVATRIVQPDIKFRMMVQCKKLAKHRKIGVEVVKNVWATKWQGGFHYAMIATTTTFTKGAVHSANQWQIELRDHDSIVNWCKVYRIP